MTDADVLRLLAVPVLGWAAYRDVEVRRVPSRTWYPLVALGAVLLAWDARRVLLEGGTPAFRRQLFLLRVGVSLGVVAPFAYLVWRVGGFGGADAKALMALAVLFPTYPTYLLDVGAGSLLVLPTSGGRTALGVFSLTVLTNTVLLGAASPLGLALRNLLAGELSRVMVVGRRVSVASLEERHGSLLETPDGYTRSGLDLDALRMYLRWRGADLEELLADPDRFRDPASIPAERFEPGDGAVDAGPPEPLERPAADGQGAAGVGEPGGGGGADANRADADGSPTATPDGDATGASEDPADGGAASPGDGVAPDDEWGAAAFLDDAGWGAYGTDPEDLRAGLEVVAGRERVWYSPGLPFIVPMFAGLVVGLTYGDLLFGALGVLGLA